MYMDDPILGIRGTPWQRKCSAVKLVSAILVLGLHMAFSKAQINNTITWIGVEVKIRPWEIIVTFPLENHEISRKVDLGDVGFQCYHHRIAALLCGEVLERSSGDLRLAAVP